MRRIELTKVEYRDFVWPAVNRISSKSEAEMRVMVEVRKGLKTLGHPLPLSKQDQEAVDNGELRYADYSTDGPVALTLEEEEWRWLGTRLRAYLPALTGYAAEDFLLLLSKVDEAERITPTLE